MFKHNNIPHLAKLTVTICSATRRAWLLVGWISAPEVDLRRTDSREVIRWLYSPWGQQVLPCRGALEIQLYEYNPSSIHTYYTMTAYEDRAWYVSNYKHITHLIVSHIYVIHDVLKNLAINYTRQNANFPPIQDVLKGLAINYRRQNVKFININIAATIHQLLNHTRIKSNADVCAWVTQ